MPGSGTPLDDRTRMLMERTVGAALGGRSPVRAGSSFNAARPFTSPADAVERQAHAVADRVRAGDLAPPTATTPAPAAFDFSTVRVHTDPGASRFDAFAYTIGNHIAFAPGRYDPATREGRALLAHELTHVLQHPGPGTVAPVMRAHQSCVHDGPPPECSGGAHAVWWLTDRTTGETTRNPLSNLVIGAAGTHFPTGTWATEVHTPRNLRREGTSDRSRADGLRVIVGPALQVDIAEVKSCGTEHSGGCIVASDQADGYVNALNSIRAEIVAVVNARNADPTLRTLETPRTRAHLAALASQGIQYSGSRVQHAWRFVHTLEGKIGALPSISSVTFGLFTGGMRGRDYSASLPILVECQVRQRRGSRRGYKVRRLVFQVNNEGGMSYRCTNTACATEEERRDEEREEVRQPADLPAAADSARRPEDRQEAPGPEVPTVVWVGGGAALTAGAAGVIARRRVARLAQQRAAAAAARALAERQIAEQLRRQALLQRAFGSQAARTATATGGRMAASTAAKAATRAVIVAELMAAVILLSSGEAEASIGPGPSALETLYRRMSASGTPPSPELRALIEQNPQLREVLEQAATGNSAPGTEEATRQMIELLRDHGHELTPEELELLAAGSEAASGTGRAPRDIAELRAALAAERQRRATGGGRPPGDATGTGAGGAGEGTGAQTGTGTGARADGGTSGGGTREGEGAGATPPASDLPPSLSEEVRAQVRQASMPRQDVVRRLISGTTGSVRVTDDVVRRILQELPENLTPQQSQQLIARIAPAGGEDLEAILGRLRQAVRDVQAQAAPDEPATDAEAPAADAAPSAEEEHERADLEAYRRRMVEWILAYRWEAVALGSSWVHLGGHERNFRTARVGRNGDVLPVVLAVRRDQGGGVEGRFAAVASVVITRRTGDVMDLRVVGASPFVNEQGAVLGTVPVGTGFTEVQIRGGVRR